MHLPLLGLSGASRHCLLLAASSPQPYPVFHLPLDGCRLLSVLPYFPQNLQCWCVTAASGCQHLHAHVPGDGWYSGELTPTRSSCHPMTQESQYKCPSPAPLRLGLYQAFLPILKITAPMAMSPVVLAAPTNHLGAHLHVWLCHVQDGSS